MEYLQELKYFLEEAKTKDDILSVQKELNIFSGKRNLHKELSKKKASVNEDHFTQLTIDGFKVLIGRNNTQNDSLTFHKAAKPIYGSM